MDYLKIQPQPNYIYNLIKGMNLKVFFHVFDIDKYLKHACVKEKVYLCFINNRNESNFDIAKVILRENYNFCYINIKRLNNNKHFCYFSWSEKRIHKHTFKSLFRS